MRVTPRNGGALLASGFLLGLLAALQLGCASIGTPTSYDYFAAPGDHDAWSPKIRGWQARERASLEGAAGVAPASVSGAGRTAESADPGEDLRRKYASYRVEQKRQMVRDLVAWIQDQAAEHYVPDGPIDHWATLEETLRHNGDDCDGLELLVYHFLLDLGFAEDEVFRAIVYRASDGQHHMVTLWFETPDDPWVIDPTGAMTTRMVRMSDAGGWQPLKVFSEEREFTVEHRGGARGIHLTQR